jgi:hypothetical protein
VHLVDCIDVLTITIEHRLDAIVEFAFACERIGNAAVTSVVFNLFAHFAEAQPDGFVLYVRDACVLTIVYLAETVAPLAVDLILIVLVNVKQEPSEALALLRSLLDALTAPAPIPEHALAIIAAAGDDAVGISEKLFGAV